MSWFSKTISLSMYWHIWHPIKLQKTLTKFLYVGYISIFGTLASLLSDRGTNFTSTIIQELCKILGIQELWTMPYHPQTNRLVGEITPDDYAHD